MGFKYSLPPSHLENLGKIKNLLWEHLRPERQAKLEGTIHLKRRDILCVFENTHHCHNISAVLRTVEAMGFLEVCFVYHNKTMRFRWRDSVERGSSQWILARRASSIASTATALKSDGYKILAVSLPAFVSYPASLDQISSLEHFYSDEFNTSRFTEWRERRPVALIFGSELVGVSPEWLFHVDGTTGVRMNGFVESLNVSVCAGMLLHGLRQVGDESFGRILSDEEKTLILEYWVARSTTNSRRIFLAKSPDLESYFDFMAAGHHFDPFPEAKPSGL